jgi:D-glycero-D-manno-heptose 1,7-bisphosphate phosphatase
MNQKAIFLDKDGTLIPDIPYNIDPDKITLSDYVAEGLELLADKGFQFIIVTNQSGVARGCFKEEALIGVQDKITRLLQEHSIRLSGFYYCPHVQNELTGEHTCICRKPLPGLLFKAAAERKINLENSWMIGDILNDVEAGNRAGCRTVLINNGNETEWEQGLYRTPTFIAAHLKDAAEYILNADY